MSGTERSHNKSIVSAIARRIQGGKDAFVLIVGERRSGKSLSSISISMAIAQELGQEYSLEKQNFFTVKTFLEAVNKDNYLEGRPVVLQEAGVGIYRRNWFKEVNKQFNHILQTIGYRRMCLILTLPSTDKIDAHALSMATFIFRTRAISPRGYVIMTPYVVGHDSVNGGTLFTVFRYRKIGEFHYRMMNVFKVDLPPKDIIARFVKADQSFKAELSRNAERGVMVEELREKQAQDRVLKKEALV